MSARVRLPLRLPGVLAGEDDLALLGRFAADRDEAAFASLIRRYGVMVLGVCRRAVGDAHLAEDAFQATFLVLARNPAAAAGATSVAGWLFGVARRVGLAARRSERRRCERERRAGDARPPSPQPDWDDLLRVLDEELAALPARYRDPLIACFLREQTQDEAARQLGWSLSTLRRRLDRAKELLRARLTRRGAALSAGLFAGLLAPSASAAVPANLADAAVLAARGPVSPAVDALAGSGLGGPPAAKAAVALGVLLLGGLAAGLGWAALPGPVAPEAGPALHPTAAPVPAAAREWATVKGRVLFPTGRAVPKPAEVPPGSIKDRDRFTGPVLFEDVLVDPKTRGIRNAVVWLRPDSDDPKAAIPPEKIHPRLARKPKEHEIRFEGPQFAPRITLARAGDTLRFTNASPVPTNVLYPDVLNGPGAAFRTFNVLLAQETGTYRPEKPLVAGTMAGRFNSTIHSWAVGYVWAFDHPYAAVTDEAGRFVIPDAPPGTWRLKVWHEKVGWIGGAAGKLGTRVRVGEAGTVTDLGDRVYDDGGHWDRPPGQ
jgi:RNA polymerase sigma factor (sigma-70 family)